MQHAEHHWPRNDTTGQDTAEANQKYSSSSSSVAAHVTVGYWEAERSPKNKAGALKCVKQKWESIEEESRGEERERSSQVKRSEELIFASRTAGCRVRLRGDGTGRDGMGWRSNSNSSIHRIASHQSSLMLATIRRHGIKARHRRDQRENMRRERRDGTERSGTGRDEAMRCAPLQPQSCMACALRGVLPDSRTARIRTCSVDVD